ncbi:MAG TPA: Holliday junction resolvase-like protein [Candidatus Dormibacteraeota bacterium]|nr:Holliday junction resolvase-like protein [Candidatus Dormibacteraeota bacterium]
MPLTDMSIHSPLALLLAIESVLLAVAVFIISVLWRKYEALLGGRDQSILAARKQSVNQSRSTLKGQISEQMAPLLPGFEYLPADSRFLGSPIDYVVFDGYTALADADPEDGESEQLEIVLLDVKQGRSQLTQRQRAIGEAVEAGRVRFEVARVIENGTVETKEWRMNARKNSSGRIRSNPDDTDEGL